MRMAGEIHAIRRLGYRQLLSITLKTLKLSLEKYEKVAFREGAIKG